MQYIIQANDFNAITHAVGQIKAGELVVFPTETVYGIGADATNLSACSKIFQIKNRPTTNPMIVHVHNLDCVASFAEINNTAYKLAERFWPGPLSIILPLLPQHRIASNVCANLTTIAVRSPSHPVAQKLLQLCDCPIAAPSANRSGHLSPTCAEHVQKDFPDKEILILDAGECDHGIESTIIGLHTEIPVLARLGAIARYEIEDTIGPIQDIYNHDATHHAIAPGMTTSHYAPSIPLRLNATAALKNETLIGFGGTKDAEFDLSLTKNLNEAARNLFAILHQIENSGATSIAIVTIPNTGIGAAINDRLRRAAAGFKSKTT